MLVRRKISELSDSDLLAIFADVKYETIPVEFIEGVKLINIDGTLSCFTGAEFKAFIQSQIVPLPVGQLELALNIDRFSKDVNGIIQEILDKARNNDKGNTSN